MSGPKRNLTLEIEGTTGTFNIFHAWLNGYSVIQTNGTKGTWEGTIPSKETKVTLEVVAYGTGTSSYTVKIDLPGTADDQNLTFSLRGGYHEFKLEF